MPRFSLLCRVRRAPPFRTCACCCAPIRPCPRPRAAASSGQLGRFRSCRAGRRRDLPRQEEEAQAQAPACAHYRKVRVKRGGHYRTVRHCVRHRKRRAPAPPPQPSFTVGMVSGPAAGWEAGLTSAGNLHPKVVRVPLQIGASVSSVQTQVAGLAAKGEQALLMAEFYGSIPSTSQAQNLATWAPPTARAAPSGRARATRPTGCRRDIEFGNETSYSYQSSDNSLARPTPPARRTTRSGRRTPPTRSTRPTRTSACWRIGDNAGNSARSG